jgi:hypothetical protein
VKSKDFDQQKAGDNQVSSLHSLYQLATKFKKRKMFDSAGSVRNFFDAAVLHGKRRIVS